MWPRRRKHDQIESEIALTEAQRNLERIKSRSSEVHEVTTARRNLLERNQFSERLKIIMEGNR